MLESISEDLKRVRKLIDDAQYKEARALLSQFEKENNLIPEERITCLILKGDLYRILGRYEDALNLSETAYDLSTNFGNNLLRFDSLFIKMKILINTFMTDEAFQLINQLNKIIESFKNVSSDLILDKEADLTSIKASIYSDLSKFEEAEEYYIKHLVIREKIGNRAKIAYALRILSYHFLVKEDFTQSLKFGEKCLAINEIHRIDKWNILAVLTGIFFRKGELDLALK